MHIRDGLRNFLAGRQRTADSVATVTRSGVWHRTALAPLHPGGAANHAAPLEREASSADAPERTPYCWVAAAVPAERAVHDFSDMYLVYYESPD
jgi:hypothetical protein